MRNISRRFIPASTVDVVQMKTTKVALVVLAVLSGVGTLRAQDVAPNANDLVGASQVDLRPTPDADAYFQVLLISSVEDGSI